MGTAYCPVATGQSPDASTHNSSTRRRSVHAATRTNTDTYSGVGARVTMKTPLLSDFGIPLESTFKDNILTFIKQFCSDLTVLHENLRRWRLHELFVYEERVVNSPRAHCDHCKCIGWNHHPVSRARYHFILTNGPPIQNEADPFMILDKSAHLLHGVLHSNGYGHLLRINGREAGSRTFSGTQVM